MYFLNDFNSKSIYLACLIVAGKLTDLLKITNTDELEKVKLYTGTAESLLMISNDFVEVSDETSIERAYRLNHMSVFIEENGLMIPKKKVLF